MAQPPLTILYQDDHLVAIDKPAGLLVHRSEISSLETQFALEMVREQLGRLVYPVHRLDRPTSGVLLFALSSETARRVCDEFESHRVEKQYTAFVRGWSADRGRIDHPLKRMKDRRIKRTSNASAEPQAAATDYATLRRFEIPLPGDQHPTSRYSLVELTPQTGRRHQLRRHMNYISHPIIGDREHGDHRQNKRIEQRFGVRRMLLVASRLRLQHPIHRCPLELVASTGDEFESVLASCESER